jgi:preprotein translocase YajC subunit
MTPTLALVHFVLGATKSTSNPLITLLPLLAIGVLGYFFFIKPQQRKAQAARAAKSSDIEVGDEVQTVGGVIGTVLEIHGDRYTILTGALGDDGNLDGPQPTRIVFVRQAIARKIEPIEDVRVNDVRVDDVRVADEPAATTDDTDASDIDDVGGDTAAGDHGNRRDHGDHGGEAEEA